MTDPERIAQIREWLDGISQAEFARRIGTSQQTVNRYENGLRGVPGPVHKLLDLIENVRGVAPWLEEHRDV